MRGVSNRQINANIYGCPYGLGWYLKKVEKMPAFFMDDSICLAVLIKYRIVASSNACY